MADIFNMLDTWNAAGTVFTGIKLNVTDTASAAGSLLMDLQVGGVSRASVRKDGRLFGNSYYFDSLSGLILGASNQVMLALEGAGAFHSYKTGHYMVGSNVTLRWSSDSSLSTTGLSAADVILARDAANTLAQRNGVNAQAFNLYNTYTDASNYERGFMRFVSNVLQIGTEKLGTGSNRDLLLSATGLIEIKTGGTTRAAFFGAATQFNSDVLPFSNGGNDLGSTSIRWKNIISLGYTELREMTAPAAPAANDVRIYAEDNGSGKTRIMALFATGAAVQIAIEP